MRIQVTNATPSQINYLVAKIEGRDPAEISNRLSSLGLYELRDEASDAGVEYESYWGCDELRSHILRAYEAFDPAGTPEHGQPILERQRIGTWPFDDVIWRAQRKAVMDPIEGPTSLIAGLRCHIADTLGDTAEVPDDLVH